MTNSENVQGEIKGGLLRTRKDHFRAASSPPIDSKFGDDVCKGDTLNDQELDRYWLKELDGIRLMLAMPPEQVKIFRESSNFLNPDFLSSDLEYCRKRGIDVTDGETLLEELKHL